MRVLNCNKSIPILLSIDLVLSAAASYRIYASERLQAIDLRARVLIYGASFHHYSHYERASVPRLRNTLVRKLIHLQDLIFANCKLIRYNFHVY